jgi:hypothetical protein
MPQNNRIIVHQFVSWNEVFHGVCSYTLCVTFWKFQASRCNNMKHNLKKHLKTVLHWPDDYVGMHDIFINKHRRHVDQLLVLHGDPIMRAHLLRLFCYLRHFHNSCHVTLSVLQVIRATLNCTTIKYFKFCNCSFRWQTIHRSNRTQKQLENC